MTVAPTACHIRNYLPGGRAVASGPVPDLFRAGFARPTATSGPDLMCASPTPAGLTRSVSPADVEGDIGVGEASFSAECIRLWLVDEYQAFTSPVVLGGGTPFFPELEQRVKLELVETRTFGQVVYLRYRGR